MPRLLLLLLLLLLRCFLIFKLLLLMLLLLLLLLLPLMPTEIVPLLWTPSSSAAPVQRLHFDTLIVVVEDSVAEVIYSGGCGGKYNTTYFTLHHLHFRNIAHVVEQPRPFLADFLCKTLQELE